MTINNDFLFEILTEELPATSILKIADAFCQQFKERLQKSTLAFEDIYHFATPRRLAIYVKGLAPSQADQIVERKGPAKTAAFDASGQPTPACIGFAKSCGVTPDQLSTIQTPQGEWMAYSQQAAGKSVEELLPKLLQETIEALPLPKRMRWGSTEVQFIRPVHSVMMLYGKEIIHAEILGCKTDRKTVGHRFHAPEVFVVPHPEQYEQMLKERYVIADFHQRREKIRADIDGKKNAGQHIQLNDTYKAALLEEVTGLVEWPVVLKGRFDDAFLALPPEVLVASMKDHQRYFPLAKSGLSTRDNNELSPQNKFDSEFIFVSNIESHQSERIIHGNERVLRARLSDAAFFYAEDLKESLVARLPRLQHIVYQAKLGSLYEKSERLQNLCGFIAKKMNIDSTQAKRAGLLAKTDLVTHMVTEFPELQGIMGQYYAAHDGEANEVCKSLSEQYLPRFAGDHLPDTVMGKILAIADRIDLLVGSFGIGQVPTGDKDPYGLRRAALGVIRIIVEGELDINLQEMIECACESYSDKLSNREAIPQLLYFIFERMRAWYLDRGITPDVFAAVAALQITNLMDMNKRIDAVKAFKTLPEVEALSIANKRVSNILLKYDETLSNDVIDEHLFEHEAEKILANQLNIQSQRIQKAYQARQYQDVLQELRALREPVDDFFDQVMVMVDDKSLRDNRILMLRQLRALFLQVADIALLQ